MYKSAGVRFADFISFFLKYLMKIKFDLTVTKLFHFHRILKNGGYGGRYEQTP